MTELDRLIIGEVLRWDSNGCFSQENGQDPRRYTDCDCDDHCKDCNHGSCYDCICDNDDWCRSEA